MKLFSERKKNLVFEAYNFIASKQTQVNQLLQTNKEVELWLDHIGLKVKKIECEYLPKVGKRIIAKSENGNYVLSQDEWTMFADDIIDYLGL